MYGVFHLYLYHITLSRIFVIKKIICSFVCKQAIYISQGLIFLLHIFICMTYDFTSNCIYEHSRYPHNNKKQNKNSKVWPNDFFIWFFMKFQRKEKDEDKVTESSISKKKLKSPEVMYMSWVLNCGLIDVNHQKKTAYNLTVLLSKWEKSHLAITNALSQIVPKWGSLGLYIH